MLKDFKAPAWLTLAVIEYLQEWVRMRQSEDMCEGFLCFGYDAAYSDGLVPEPRKKPDGEDKGQMEEMLAGLGFIKGAYMFEPKNLPTWFIELARRANVDVTSEYVTELNERRLFLLELLKECVDD